ncbi:hypothetical protein M8542_19370 [Amycolatopsis sp. OK19-0408]|uniref:Uncharacterized protein n=1 Tax=Amycolatopsis iheyensis TaxID=2945988 RepID=A0A9X2NAE6_9PSEU|nr:hypothetical protein [Amycolatopsis iheyensis]MCR6484994.1 hypothetical protein [Amycolatopsis iheyensis]
MTTPTDLLIARQLEVHDHLIGRGWRLDGDAGPGDAKFLDDPTAGWSYPASFGGARTNTVGDATPSVLQCYFTFDNEGDVVFAAVPAGNLHGSGCAAHDTTERQYPLTARGTVDLPALTAELDDLEPRARAHDVRALVECLFFGPCPR